jgi:hypothetical protein
MNVSKTSMGCVKRGGGERAVVRGLCLSAKRGEFSRIGKKPITEIKISGLSPIKEQKIEKHCSLTIIKFLRKTRA